MEYGHILTLSPDAKVGSDFANDLLAQFEISQTSSLFSTMNNQDSEEDDLDLNNNNNNNLYIGNETELKDINNNYSNNNTVESTISQQHIEINKKRDIINNIQLTENNTVENNAINHNNMDNDKNISDGDKDKDKKENKDAPDQMDIDNDTVEMPIQTPPIENDNKNNNINNDENKKTDSDKSKNNQVTPIVEQSTTTTTTVLQQQQTKEINNENDMDDTTTTTNKYDNNINNDQLITTINNKENHLDHHQMDNINIKNDSIKNNTFPRRSKTLKLNSSSTKKRSLLRRSSAYLRQKFFASSTTSPNSPPLPSQSDISTTLLDDNINIKSVATPTPLPSSPNSNPKADTPSIKNNEKINHDNSQNDKIDNNVDVRINHDEAMDYGQNNNNNMNDTTTIDNQQQQQQNRSADTTTNTLPMIPPMVTPCQYPPKPLTYSAIVDPPNDNHRSSFPILHSWRISMLDPRRKSEPLVQPKKRRSIF